MKKIMYVYGGELPSKSASSVHVAKMCSALSRYFNVFLVSKSSNRSKINDFYDLKRTFKFYGLPIPDIRRMEIFVFLYALISSVLHKVDYIYTRDVLMAYLAISFKKKTIFEFHNIGFINTRFNKFLFNKIQSSEYLVKNIVITESLKCDSIDYLNVRLDTIEVLPDSADLAIPNFDSFDPKSVGYVGSLFEGKGSDIIPLIAHHMPDLLFHIVGGEKEQVKELTKKSPCNVIYHGFVDQVEVSKYISKFEVCLLPNQRKVIGAGKFSSNIDIGKYTSPLKLFQYMSQGKKIVCSDLNVIREVVDEKGVWFAECDSINSWVSGIRAAVTDKTKEKERYVHAKFEKLYTWDVRAKRIKAILE